MAKGAKKVENIATLTRENRDEIIKLWEERVRRDIKASKGKESLAIIDHLVPFLETLAQSIEKASKVDDVRKLGFEVYDANVNQAHGRLRSALSGYTVDQVIHEYAILRQTVTDFLQKRNLLSVKILELINLLTEKALLSAATSFTLALEAQREKVASMLVHDFRTPLTAISLAAEAQQMEDARDPYAKTIVDNVERLTSMIEEFLDAYKIEAGEGIHLSFKKANFTKFMKKTVDSMEASYKRHFNCILPDKDLHGTFSPAAVTRVVENLVMNAVKYGDPDKEIRMEVKEQDGFCEVSITNYGNPIPKSEQKHIFSPLKRLEDGDGKKGWGLGLAFAKEVAEAHSGDISVESSKEQGTTFRVRFLINETKTDLSILSR